MVPRRPNLRLTVVISLWHTVHMRTGRVGRDPSLSVRVSLRLELEREVEDTI